MEVESAHDMNTTGHAAAHGFECGPIRPAGHSNGNTPGSSIRFLVELIESSERHYQHHWETFRGTREPVLHAIVS